MSQSLTWEETRDRARQILSPRCKVCPECNGRACVGKMPGPGGKGRAKTFQRNYDYLHEQVRLHMDMLGEGFTADTSISLFGRELSLPVFAAPIGMVGWSLSDTLNDRSYSCALIEGMLRAGTLACTGGGKDKESFTDPLAAVQAFHGEAIFNIKPWKQEKLLQQIRLVEAAGVPAFVVDIDSAGLPHARDTVQLLERKNTAKLAELVQATTMDLLVKGIMTPDAAIRAADAGVYGIVVSNHGGRVMDEGLSTAEVLPAIRDAVGDRVKVLVDGGVRTGYDVFKMLALGADAVLIGRPYMWAVYGGGAEGVAVYTEKLRGELVDAMNMTGCASLSAIDRSKIQVY